MSQTLEKYLIDLMHQHDCVVIPGMGGLVANYTPGFLDAQHQIMQPPKKGFVWNRFLQHNDGLLVHEISKVENVTYADGLLRLNKMLAEVKETLDKTRRIDFSSMGSFYLDTANTLRFLPKKDNYLISSFGLPVVKALALPKMVILPKEEETKDVQTEQKKPLGKVIAIQDPIDKGVVKVSNSRWWIAAALIPLGFYSAWVPMKTDLLNPNGHFQYSDLNPFAFEKPTAHYNSIDLYLSSVDSLPKVHFDVFDAFSQIKEVTISQENNVLVPETTFVDIKAPEVTYAEVKEKTYFIIGGCFSDEENALNFVSQLKSEGFDAKLVDVHEGLHRVAFGSYSDKEVAKEAKDQITASGEYSAWVLKKEVK